MSNFDKNTIIYMYAYLCVRVGVYIIIPMCIYNYIIESNKVRMHHKYNYLILHN